MTNEQREAAIERMYGPLPTDGVTRRDVADALDALLSEFVVLHRDDVTEERTRVTGRGGRASRRLVTRWEPKACPTCGGRGELKYPGACRINCNRCNGSGIDGGTA